jgi:membrane-bound metal-dependent hydrolase YbcI (DUF457 family)
VPFTIAHAAAALPLRRTRLIQSAVVIGCFVPDFEYFVRLAPRSGGGHTFSHTLPGLFVIDLPLALAIFWLFHRYAKESLWAWLPPTIRERVKLGPGTSPFGSVAQSTLVLASIFVGAVTHILWDSFTHASFWPYRHLPFLSYQVWLPITGSVLTFRLLQSASSVLGTLVVLIWVTRQLMRAPINPRRAENATALQRRDLIFVSAVALVGGALRALHGLRPPDGPHRMEVFIAEAAITAITLFFIQSIIFGFLREKTASTAQAA